MENVFLSSLARDDMGAIRKAAKEAIESLGMHPAMFETEGANEADSRSALLALIPNCDAYLLLLGAEYGEPGNSGLSPTEEEFEEALSAGIPILALVQEGVEREPRQQAFVDWVRGAWEDGHFAPVFTDTSDVVTATVRALSGWKSRASDAAAREAATARVRELAGGHNNAAGVAILRTIAVPLIRRPLLDAVKLTDSATADSVTAAARTSGLVSQSEGVEPAVTADSITITWAPGRGFDRLQACVATDGSVTAEGTAGADRDNPGSLGWMVVLHDRLPIVINQALQFTDEVWRTLDTRRDIRQTYLGAAVGRVGGKSYSFQQPQGRVSTPFSTRLGDPLIVPDEPPARPPRRPHERRERRPPASLDPSPIRSRRRHQPVLRASAPVAAAGPASRARLGARILALPGLLNEQAPARPPASNARRLMSVSSGLGVATR